MYGILYGWDGKSIAWKMQWFGKMQEFLCFNFSCNRVGFKAISPFTLTYSEHYPHYVSSDWDDLKKRGRAPFINIFDRTGNTPSQFTVMLQNWDWRNAVSSKGTHLLLAGEPPADFCGLWIAYQRGSRKGKGRRTSSSHVALWDSLLPDLKWLQRCWAFTLTLVEKIHARNLL